MKNSFLIALATGLFLAVTIPVTIISCSKEQVSNRPESGTTSNNTPANNNNGSHNGKNTPLVESCSCSITCSNGSHCSASGTAGCNCKCDAFGDAKCNSSSANHAVAGVPGTITFISGMQTLLASFDKSYANTASENLQTIKELFQDNGYNITSSDDLAAYYDASDNLDVLIEQFTSSEQQQIIRYKEDNRVE